MKNNWIKISDKRPEIEEEVLVYEEWFNGEVARTYKTFDVGYIEHLTIRKDGVDITWSTERGITPTHWQPLEEPDE